MNGKCYVSINYIQNKNAMLPLAAISIFSLILYFLQLFEDYASIQILNLLFRQSTTFIKTKHKVIQLTSLKIIINNTNQFLEISYSSIPPSMFSESWY